MNATEAHAPAYMCGGRIALQRTRGAWDVYTLEGYDPIQYTWREWVQLHPPIASATNRRAAIVEVKR